jgi:hypothetical protein
LRDNSAHPMWRASNIDFVPFFFFFFFTSLDTVEVSTCQPCVEHVCVVMKVI